MKQNFTIELDVPENVKAVEYRPARPGEKYLKLTHEVAVWPEGHTMPYPVFVVVEEA